MNLLGPKEGLTTVHLLICFSQVWYKGLSEINIISRFKATGIFPTNRDKYNIKWFDQQLYTATSIGFSQLDKRTLMQKLKQTMRFIMNYSMKKLIKKTQTILQLAQQLQKTKILLMVVKLVRRQGLNLWPFQERNGLWIGH